MPLPSVPHNDFSLLHRKFEEDCTAEACAPLNVPGSDGSGISLLAYGALEGGTLSGKISPEGVGPAESRHVRWPAFQPRYYNPAVLRAAHGLKALAVETDQTAAQLALRWTRQREYMGAVIIGATNLAQLDENLAAFESDEELSPELLERIDALEEQTAAAYFQRSESGPLKSGGDHCNSPTGADQAS